MCIVAGCTNEPLTLVLPLPPSPNRRAGNFYVAHSAKRKYQLAVWAAAYQQVVPPLEPPERVRVSARFYVHAKRDPDNLTASLKYVLDALRQQQSSRAWRQGLGAWRGYFVDDDPAHLELGDVEQAVDRKNKRLELTIEDYPRKAAA